MKSRYTTTFVYLFWVAINQFCYSQTRDYKEPIELIKNGKSSFQLEAKKNRKPTNYNQKSTYCTSTTEGTVPLIDCDDVGTSAFNTNSYVANNASATEYVWNNGPSPSPTCWDGYEWAGDWIVLDLDPGVTTVSVNMDNASGSFGAYAYVVWITFYQGTSCSNLTQVACEDLLVYDWLYGWIPLDPIISGLDPNLPLWVYVSCDDVYNLYDIQFNGASAATNSSCATAISTTEGCNAGVNGDESWTGPNNNGQTCTGGTWYSNENTVYYTFTATQENATLDVENVICNDGTNGEIQIGVWEDCADVGTYGSGFLGCAVGSGTLSLPSLTIGETYILVADGQAGDICNWDFVTTGIILPVELISLYAENQRGYNEITWSTATESNSDYFIVQKSFDGTTYEDLDLVQAAGQSMSQIDYEYRDYNQTHGTVYYRLKQVDFDGEVEFHGPRPLTYNGNIEFSVAPNPSTGFASVIFESSRKGNASLQVTGTDGKVVINRNMDANKGGNAANIDLTGQQAGVYIVTVITPSKTHKARLVIK